MVKINLEAEELVPLIIEGMREKKAFDITVMDLRELKSPLTSYFIICSGNSDAQTKAISDSVIRFLKEKAKERPFQVEGERRGEWILVDYVDIVVHIFLPRIREFYKIEELWGDAVITNYEN